MWTCGNKGRMLYEDRNKGKNDREEDAIYLHLMFPHHDIYEKYSVKSVIKGATGIKLNQRINRFQSGSLQHTPYGHRLMRFICDLLARALFLFENAWLRSAQEQSPSGPAGLGPRVRQDATATRAGRCIGFLPIAPYNVYIRNIAARHVVNSILYMSLSMGRSDCVSVHTSLILRGLKFCTT